MAKLTMTTYALDMRSFSFTGYYDATAAQVTRHTPTKFAGGVSGTNEWTGTGFKYDASDRLIDGTINSLFSGFGDANIILTGIALDAADVRAARNTRPEQDDLAVARSIFTGRDTISGADENDVLRGFSGNDVLNGAGGRDNIAGGFGNDTIRGGLGPDVIAGNAGNDRFVFLKGDSSAGLRHDTIADFDQAGNDVIDFASLAPGTLTYRGNAPITGANQVRIVDITGPDLLIRVNLDGNRTTTELEVLLADTAAASMTKGDFIL